MAVNKNFVVKNGLEVGTDIIVASVDNKNVGVGTTVGQVLLDVRGAIGATDLSVSGVGTVVTLNSTNFTGTAGTITTLTSTDATITNGTITGLTGTAGTITTLTSTDTTITNATITNGTITGLTGTAGTITTLTSTDATITNGTVTNLTGTAGTITNGTVTNLTGTAGTITTLTSTDATITNGTITGLTGTAGTITTLTSTDATITNGTITNGTVTNLTGTAGTITTLTSTDATITNGTVTSLTGTAATITTLTSTDATITNGTVTNGTITGLTGTAGTITTLTSTDATITNGTVTSLTGTAATITTLTSTNATVTNLTPVNVNASGVITATSYYGDGSNLSNVGGYWIQNDAGIHTTGSVGVGTTNPDSVVPSDNTSILNVGILTAYKLYGDGSALTGLAGNPALQTVLDQGNTSTTGMSITGVSTFTTAEVTNGNITNLTGTAGTITTLTSTDATITNLTPTNINSSGVTTVTTLDVQSNLDVYDSEATFHNNVYIAGNLSIGGSTVTLGVQNLTITDKDIIVGYTTNASNDDVSTDTTANHGGIAVASTEGSPLVPFKVTGINTLPDTYKQLMWVKGGTYGAGTTDAWMSNYAVGVGSTVVPTGVVFAAGGIQFTDSTITTPTVTIGSGIVTATSGIVTYYGDGQFLSNVISGVGINTAGGNVGYGVTLLDLRGSGISTVTFDSATGIGTINVEGGGESTQIIKDTFTVSGSQSAFDLSQTYTTGTLDVYLNGVKLNSSDYTETDSDTITLGSAAVDGDILEVLNFKATGTLIAPVPIVETESFAVGVGTLITLNLSSAQDHKVTATGITTITCSGGTEGESHTVRIVNSGISTIGFSTYFLWPSGSSPTLPTADSSISLISFTVHSVGAGGTQLLAGASVNFS